MSVGIKKAIKDIVVIFTIFGILNFSAEFFWQRFISEIFWWIPQMSPPDSYQVFFSFFAAAITILPSYQPSSIFGKPIKVAETTGIQIAIKQAGANNDFVVIPLSLSQFTCKLPEGWILAHKHCDSTKYRIQVRPSNNLINRLKATRLDLLVFQYSSPTILDQEQFRQATYLNLHDSTIMEDKLSTRHGVMSHECMYKQGIGYGYVVRFIKQSNEFIIRWFSFDDAIYRHYLSDVEAFIESFHFDVSHN